MMAGFFLVPFAIGCGFGIAHHIISKRLADQHAVDSDGIAVTARVEAIQVEIVEHHHSAMDSTEAYPTPSRFCNIAVSYRMPDSDHQLDKQFRLEDDTIVDRYNVGDPITARVLPGQPDVIVLDEGRLGERWYWISLSLCASFVGLPFAMLLRIAYVRRRDSLKTS